MTAPADLSDEQFREARRQICERLQYLALQRTEQAAEAIKADCSSAFNCGHGAEQAREDAQGFWRAHREISGMEREGFNWGAGA